MAETIDSISGNSITGDDLIMSDGPTASTSSASAGVRSTIKQKFAEHSEELRDQAKTKARAFAEQGKEKAATTLDGISQFIEETAAALDEQLGEGVGEYVHRAAGAVSGFTDTLKSKDVEELFSDAREAVRRNPAVAIGAAAAAGFILVRLLKSTSDTDGDTKPSSPKSSRKPSATKDS